MTAEAAAAAAADAAAATASTICRSWPPPLPSAMGCACTHWAMLAEMLRAMLSASVPPPTAGPLTCGSADGASAATSRPRLVGSTDSAPPAGPDRAAYESAVLVVPCWSPQSISPLDENSPSS